MSPWIIHPADRLNALRALVAPPIGFAPFFFDSFAANTWLYGIGIFFLIGKTNYLLHLHIHHPFSRNSALNLLLDLSMGSVSGMTSSNWRIQHLYGHHRGIDLPYRGKRTWQLEKYSPLRAMSFSIGTLWTTFFSPIEESFRKGIRANQKVPINYRWAFLEQSLLIVFVGALALWQPRLVSVYLLPWYFVTHFVTRYVDYLNHYGCAEAGGNRFAVANNCLSRWFNFTTHNFGYHAAHHLRPGAHWTTLPEIHATVAGEIPEKNLKPFSWSGILLPYHFVRSFRGEM
jgi:fatty acid desaturase